MRHGCSGDSRLRGNDEPMKLKADLHIHTKEDLQDNIDYDAYELIDMVSEKGFDVISITNHNCMTYNDELSSYAQDKGILLIPGIEKTIEGDHVVFLNADLEEVNRTTSLRDLKSLEDDRSLIIAPHPFIPSKNSLNSHFEKHIDLFDAVEYTGFYFRYLNFNKKAERLARKYGLPMIGCSDAHFVTQIGSTYTLIDAEKSIESIIHAIKSHSVEVISEPLPFTLQNIKLAGLFVLGGFYTP